MGKDSKIEWTHHTFNPWIGCTKVSEGCAHCYAERLNKRMGWTQWGDSGARVRTSESNWKQPLAWNRQCEKSGTRARVFCASLADWLDYKAPTEWRVDLLRLIFETPKLDWLLLTKRPESWSARMLECASAGSSMAHNWVFLKAPPENVWVGVSAENNAAWKSRVRELTAIPAFIRFVSAEPLLGPIEIAYESFYSDPDWVIVGGESGPGARPMNPDWVRGIQRGCADIGAAFFFKQWGGVDKKSTGRELDGRTWDEIPEGGKP